MLSLYWTTEKVGETVTLRAEDKTGVVCVTKAEDDGFDVTFYLRKKARKCLWMYERFLEVPYKVSRTFVDQIIMQTIDRLNDLRQ